MTDATASGWRAFAAAAKPRLAMDRDKWITVHGSPNAKGSPVLLGPGGVVKGGLGGKFTGKTISEVRGKAGGIEPERDDSPGFLGDEAGKVTCPWSRLMESWRRQPIAHDADPIRLGWRMLAANL